MKNVSLILNIILLAAVAHLYYLNFSKSTPAPTMTTEAPTIAAVKVAYVNYDTLDMKSVWLSAKKKVMEDRVKNAESTIIAKEDALNREANALREKFNGGNMTEADAAKAQRSLMERGQKLSEEKDRLEKSLAETAQKENEALYQVVDAKLKAFAQQLGYDYILSYTRGGQILYTNGNLEVTKQVIDLLDAEGDGTKK